MKSHDTLVRQDFSIDYADGFKLTQLDAYFVEGHKDAIDYLLSDEFNYDDVKNAFDSITIRTLFLY